MPQFLAEQEHVDALGRIRPRYSGSCSQREAKISEDNGDKGRGLWLMQDSAFRSREGYRPAMTVPTQLTH